MIKYSVINNNTYLLFTYNGDYNFNKSLELISAIKSDCTKNDIFKVFLDTSKIKKDELSNLNRFNLGVEISKVLNSKIQLAILDNEKGINHLVEITANNRSSYVKASSDKTELLKWLA